MKKLIVIAAAVMAMEVVVSCKDSNKQTTEEENAVETLATDTITCDSTVSQTADSANAQK